MRKRSTAMQVLTLPALLLALGGCFPFFGNRPGATGLMRKQVIKKEPPTSLIAYDYTRCLVTEERFREVVVGTTVTCFWTSEREGRVVNGTGAAGASVPQKEVSGKTSDMSAKGAPTAAAAAKSRKPND